ncbi:MAG: site-specific integrase [Halopseudomonas sabulinigri]
MLDETKYRYLKLASHFYESYMKGSVVSFAEIEKCLLFNAVNFQPAYFRRLKNAIACDLECKGLLQDAVRVKAIVNPVTAKDSALKKKSKPQREKKFSDDDFHALITHLAQAGCAEEFAAISLIRLTGARPAELCDMRTEAGLVFIAGAKKSKEVRGADRVLYISNESDISSIVGCLRIIKKSKRSIDAIRHRLRIEVLNLWPRRKVVPSMYSMRHQVGANLKASKFSEKEIAYMMGHQSTNSARRYGDKRQGDAKAMSIQPAKDADLSQIRDKAKLKNKPFLPRVLQNK